MEIIKEFKFFFQVNKGMKIIIIKYFVNYDLQKV